MVLFSILDHYLRRPENQKRVIGTLLGTVTTNVVEVTNSFAVPHLEKNEEVSTRRFGVGGPTSGAGVNVVQQSSDHPLFALNRPLQVHSFVQSELPHFYKCLWSRSVVL